jgi:hypothetical protein
MTKGASGFRLFYLLYGLPWSAWLHKSDVSAVLSAIPFPILANG